MNFGEAIDLVKKGKLVTRSGWNGKGMFVFQRISKSMPLSQMLGLNTLPKGVKDYFEGKHQPILSESVPVINFTNYLCMKAADDTIVNGWLASQTDMLAEDWQEFSISEAIQQEKLKPAGE